MTHPAANRAGGPPVMASGAARKSVNIYTDGACSGNPGPGGWAAILLYKGAQKEITGYEDDTTNNRMELTAAIRALECLKVPCDVTLYSDSAYLVDAIQKNWLNRWIKNGWRLSDKNETKNIDLWQALRGLLDIHSVMFEKVPGHADNYYNNMCDRLAVAEIAKNGKNDN